MKVLKFVIGGLVTTLINAVLSLPFVWVGWNFGVVPASDSVYTLTAYQAGCLSLFICVCASMLRPVFSYSVNDG
jgi:hypothetical protein